MGRGPDKRGQLPGLPIDGPDSPDCQITCMPADHDRTSGTQTPSATRNRNCTQPLRENKRHQAQSAKHKGAHRPSSVQLKSQGGTAREGCQRPSPKSAASQQLPAHRSKQAVQTGEPLAAQATTGCKASSQQAGTEPKRNKREHRLKGAPQGSHPRRREPERGAPPRPGSPMTCGHGPAQQNQPAETRTAPWPC